MVLSDCEAFQSYTFTEKEVFLGITAATPDEKTAKEKKEKEQVVLPPT